MNPGDSSLSRRPLSASGAANWKRGEKTYLSVLSMLGATMYPAYHRQHHTYQYGPESAYPEIKAMAREVNDHLYDYIENLLNPYICGETLTAADFYLYMISRWNLDR